MSDSPTAGIVQPRVKISEKGPRADSGYMSLRVD